MAYSYGNQILPANPSYRANPSPSLGISTYETLLLGNIMSFNRNGFTG